MKKKSATALCAVVAMSCFMVNSGKNEPMSDLMQANVNALAVNEDPDDDGGGGGGGTNHSGGLANVYCPIWNVHYDFSFSTLVTVGCDTGGQYKCKEGKCPHGV